MLDFFASISSAISTAFSFFLGFLRDLGSMLAIIPRAGLFMNTCISFMPLPLKVFALLSLTIIVVFLIIDR